MVECSKADWKIFRSRIGGWQEKYIEKLNKEYIELLQGEDPASIKFWALEERIRRDSKHPGVILEMRKSRMIYNILCLLRDGVIEFEDLEEFSEELKEQISYIVKRR